MVVHSKFYDLMPEQYGYVLLGIIANMCVNIWMGFKVGGARKKFGVKVCQVCKRQHNLFIVTSIIVQCAQSCFAHNTGQVYILDA